MADFAASSASTGWADHYTWCGFRLPRGVISPALVDTTGIGTHDMFVARYNDSGWDNVVRADNGANMYVSPDAWHSVRYDLTVGSGYTMTLDGVTSSFIALESGVSAYHPIGLLFHTNVNQDDAKFYVDGVSVPEPTSLMMLLGAMVGMVAYAWKRRR